MQNAVLTFYDSRRVESRYKPREPARTPRPKIKDRPSRSRRPFRRNYISVIGFLSAKLSQLDVNPFVNTPPGNLAKLNGSGVNNHSLTLLHAYKHVRTTQKHCQSNADF